MERPTEQGVEDFDRVIRHVAFNPRPVRVMSDRKGILQPRQAQLPKAHFNDGVHVDGMSQGPKLHVTPEPQRIIQDRSSSAVPKDQSTTAHQIQVRSRQPIPATATMARASEVLITSNTASIKQPQITTRDIGRRVPSGIDARTSTSTNNLKKLPWWLKQASTIGSAADAVLNTLTTLTACSVQVVWRVLRIVSPKGVVIFLAVSGGGLFVSRTAEGMTNMFSHGVGPVLESVTGIDVCVVPVVSFLLATARVACPEHNVYQLANNKAKKHSSNFSPDNSKVIVALSEDLLKYKHDFLEMSIWLNDMASLARTEGLDESADAWHQFQGVAESAVKAKRCIDTLSRDIEGWATQLSSRIAMYQEVIADDPQLSDSHPAASFEAYLDSEVERLMLVLQTFPSCIKKMDDVAKGLKVLQRDAQTDIVRKLDIRQSSWWAKVPFTEYRKRSKELRETFSTTHSQQYKEKLITTINISEELISFQHEIFRLVWAMQGANETLSARGRRNNAIQARIAEIQTNNHVGGSVVHSVDGQEKVIDETGSGDGRLEIEGPEAA